MHGIGGTSETYTAQKVSAVFRTRFGECVTLTMNTKPVLTNPFPAATLTHFDVQFLKDYNIFLSNPDANGEMVKPRILIGVEAYETVVLLDSTPTKLPSGLLAQNTVFGPALFGKSDAIDRTSYAEHVVVACPETLSDVKQELREMYELEDIYILCFNNACRNRTRNDTTTFALPPSTRQKYVNITVYSRALIALFLKAKCAYVAVFVTTRRYSRCRYWEIHTVGLLEPY
ncbi:hypothetical protein Q1695_009641 [Nippostrongylus brasiliensis]|nr:hypothetical protein Q1695_009641 [Nippostrongylus brasiliensis]